MGWDPDMAHNKSIWNSSDCALVLMDYQPEIIETVFEQDRRLIDLNVRALADTAVRFQVPVVLSTVSVADGINSPTIESLKHFMPEV
jgi:hypothetical protein